jgi:hypothetical protein
MRDFDPKNVKLAKADPDLVQISLATKNLKAGGPENIVLSVAIAGRAKIQFWDTGTKNNQIATPTNWTVMTMPASVYMEGLLESAALMEVTLTLQILNKGTVVSTDKCVLTVTPVLTNLVVTRAAGAFPDIVNDGPPLGWLIQSNGGGIAGNTFTANASAQWTAVRAGSKLRFIQVCMFTNNLESGSEGAYVNGEKMYNWDYAPPNTGAWLVDCAAAADVPFFTNRENFAVAGGVATNSVQDSPAIALNLVNNVLPPVDGTTQMDVTYLFITYATVAFNDNSIYCLDQQTWNVHYQGTVNCPAAGNYTYTRGGDNADNPSGAFGANVRNNANPLAIGPTIGNAGGLGWRPPN